MNVLVVAAHPDDEILGCGGTMAKLSEAGHRVRIAILGEGATARAASRAAGLDAGRVAELEDMARQAALAVGAEGVDCIGLPDNRFDAVPLLDVVKEVEKRIAASSPSLILTHGGGDVNIDHAVTHRAVMTAARPLPGTCVRSLYAFEIPSSTEWSFGRLGGMFTPDTYVDIAGTLERKLAALRIYAPEMRDFPHPRSYENVEALARVRGATAGFPAAEAFERIWSVDL